ncbi:hypothetical protein I4F81_011824 [Pyropia yezoensis]|uniref:Uncharacterized protein n=1 Tax=Pyropia yezoensis TaxID=2788 RepID=A0ACC3CGL7_PYRYE|nr:hypothetical protein I4F81_011824 [Neopyropia yezoensis]
MRGTHAAIASDLLNAACTLTDKIGGVTFASSLDYTTMSEATTISGRRVLPVDNLFCPDPEQLSCIIYKGLSTLASKGFMMTRDAEKSDACSALFQNIRTDLFVARETRTQPQPSAMSQVQLQSSAKGLSYLCGGHMRTAVDLAIWLTQAGSLVRPHRPHVSIKMLMEKIQHAASSAIAEHAWNLADAADIDYVLSVVLLDLPEDTTADQRWEQAGCDLEWLQSCYRHLQQSRYKEVTLSELFNARESAYAGKGPLLHKVRVDVSHARTGCTRSDLKLLLSQAKQRGDDVLLDQVHRLRLNAVSLDAVWFFRVVDGPGADALVGRLIMIGVQFKCSTSSRLGVYPGVVYRDWDNLRVLLGEHYDDWVGRFVYLNYADWNVSFFPNGLTIRRHGRAIPEHCAEHSVVRGRKQLEACVGATASHFIRTMHWMYQCNVTGPV